MNVYDRLEIKMVPVLAICTFPCIENSYLMKHLQHADFNIYPPPGTSDNLLTEGWYKLTAGLGYMPTSIFIGTQCSATYHGHLRDSHPARLP